MRKRILTLILAALAGLMAVSAAAPAVQTAADSSKAVAPPMETKKKAPKGKVYVGKRGGLYRISKSGKKIYVPSKKKPKLSKTKKWIKKHHTP